MLHVPEDITHALYLVPNPNTIAKPDDSARESPTPLLISDGILHMGRDRSANPKPLGPVGANTFSVAHSAKLKTHELASLSKVLDPGTGTYAFLAGEFAIAGAPRSSEWELDGVEDGKVVNGQVPNAEAARNELQDGV